VLYYDVQPQQIVALQDTLEAQGLEVQEVVPVVTMRLIKAGALPVEEMRRDPERRRELSWAHTREYRSSYRETLSSAEKVVAGTYQAVFEPAEGRVPEVSLEADLALDLGVTLGDTLLWNISGRRVATVVGSLREVEWRRLQTNFFVLFPVGVLEQAPQFGVVLARSPAPETSARAQAVVAQAFPAVSGVDLDQALTIFDALFSRIAFIVRFMAGFALLTGALVLISAVMLSRVQREGEVVLLKTLGASYAQVRAILRIEYLAIGFLGALVGVVLALGAGWALARFVFESQAVFPVFPLAIGTVVVMLTTLWISQIAGRGIYQRPALEVLKAET
jgi:putative ABC transport system permease protein